MGLDIRKDSLGDSFPGFDSTSRDSKHIQRFTENEIRVFFRIPPGFAGARTKFEFVMVAIARLLVFVALACARSPPAANSTEKDKDQKYFLQQCELACL
eukprot:1330565-Amorphochlora_amoeboformis.AAC.2